ncbi:MAG TPA: hypothetical protein VLC74_12865, partial [Rhizomicrobium sp.]|nr:hypothetical protein [Rhizomicrobium sp.]
MKLERDFSALEAQLRGQVALLDACVARIAAARDPQLKSAWISAVVRLMNASAATGSAMADIKWAPASTAFMLPIGLCLPPLPRLPEEGEGPPAEFCKTTSAAISRRNSGLRLAGRLRIKSKGGAPKGNRNAQKSGAHTAAFRQFRRELAAYVGALKAQLAAIRAALPRPKTRMIYAVVRPERCYVRVRRSGRPVQLSAAHRLADAGGGGQAERQPLDGA